MTQKIDGLINLLTKQSHWVIRFDHRDTGRSSVFPTPPDGSSEPAYTLTDLADDVIGLIHHLQLDAVHLVGFSMGGPIAWQVAARLPSKVASLALCLTSPVGRQQLPTDNLPPMHLEGQWLLGEAFDPPQDENNFEAWVQFYMGLDLCLATQPPTAAEREDSRRQSELTYRRDREGGTVFTKFHHSGASGVRWPREMLKQVKCPTVVIHGAKDQMFPAEHAAALRDDVDGARLVVVENCGHELPHRAHQPIVDAICENMVREQR